MTDYNQNFQSIEKKTIEKISNGTYKIINVERRTTPHYFHDPLRRTTSLEPEREVIITCLIGKSENEKLQDKIKTLEEVNKVLNEKLDSLAKILKEDVVSKSEDLGRFQRFAKYTDDQLNDMIDAYDRLVIDSACKVV